MMRSIIPLLITGLASASEPSLLVFGVSYHQDRSKDYNEFNPGIGYSTRLGGDDTADLIGSVGIYYDSYRKPAVFAMPGIRWGGTWWCADWSLGPYHGSGFTALGSMATVGFKVERRTWLHVAVVPVWGDAMAGLFVRWEL